MDVEKFIDIFAKRTKKHIQYKVDVAGERYADEDLEYNQFWMGYMVAYEEIAVWFDTLFDDGAINCEMKLSYPAVIDRGDNNGEVMHKVWFPDLNDTFSGGPGLTSTVERAEDILTEHLKLIINSTDEELPKPSSVKDLKECYPDQFILMITANIKK